MQAAKSSSSKLKAPAKVPNPLRNTANNKTQENEPSAVNSEVTAKSKRKAPESTGSEPPAKRPIAKPVSVAAAASKTRVNPTKTTIGSAPAATMNIGNMAKKKRPAWDTKGRLEDMEKLTENLQGKVADSEKNVDLMRNLLKSSETRVGELETFRVQLETNMASKQLEIREKLELIQELEEKLKAQESNHTNEINTAVAKLTAEIELLERERKTLSAELEETKKDLKFSREEVLNLKSATIVCLEGETRALKSKLSAVENCLNDREGRIGNLAEDLQQAKQLIESLESKIRQDEQLRRKLHNTIQELKGNIRVFCRVRPVLPNEENGTLSKISYPDKDDGKQIVMEQTVESASGMQSVVKNFDFEFDKVFMPSASQAIVFDEISQLVQSACDGYNVCLFAYGQTGSGKTYTMEGPDDVFDNPDAMGMIPRGVLQIYKHTDELKEKGWLYEMEGSFLEIYNETIRDLLVDDNSQDSSNKKHEIRHLAGTNKTTVTDMTVKRLSSPEQVFSLLKKAKQNRKVAETLCNERSSRSHSVFMLKINGRNEVTGESCEGVLNLIDLAGSERLSQSGSTGERLKETQAINKSLSALGDVVFALANPKDNPHVPYRNSKLTYLLQNSLGGNSKTLMFVNLSPLEKNFQETLCSLRFATKVNSCQIGTARRTVK